MSAYEEKDMVITNSEAAEQRPHAKILTINRPCPSRQPSAQLLSTINDVDSTRSLTPPGTATNEKTIETTYTTAINERDLLYADLEAQSLTTQKTQVSASKTGLLNTACSRVDSAWPGRNHMKQQKKAAKLERSRCGCWAGLSKTYKALIISAITLAILGVALGIGFGLSQKVGGTINDGTGDHKPAVHSKKS
ncbi:uncharacterized protein RAG0_01039 [Rhynchosporium agropyri]|uniref:Uncharacterized protein n=1 Tax=Rhynchosporium agropyri TaxID=914238 RepID=A0A1E1JVL8_9HELO|nr:uncharacterized protein RAG0_01039 [Rhynchosporium agropyri]